jgi:hypothetical protein
MTKKNIENQSRLTVAKEGNEYVLLYDGQPVTTDGGNKVTHKSDHLLHQMRLQGYPPKEDSVIYSMSDPYDDYDDSDRSISKDISKKGREYDFTRGTHFILYSLQKDYLEKGHDDLDQDLKSFSFHSDRIFFLEENERIEYPIMKIIGWLKENGTDLPNLLPKLSPQLIDEVRDALDDMSLDGQVTLEPKDRPKIDQTFYSIIRKLYLSLNIEERVFVNSWHSDTGDIVFPIAVVSEVCAIDDLDWLLQNYLDNNSFWLDDPKPAYKYLLDYNIGIPDTSALADIQLGENKNREFKSTLRYSLHAKKNDDEITYACLKTIAAFLNTDGGELFIGISDKGEVLGIEKDGFPNNDKYQLHLYNLIKSSLGTNFAALVNAKIKEVGGQRICVVSCEKSKEPVYLKFKKKDEEYFIRTGPGNSRLSTSEAYKYIKDKFE